MARIGSVSIARLAVLLGLLVLIGGCASYKANLAYEEAEKLAATEDFDAATEKYFEAARLDPSSKKYKLELLSSRARAAAGHVLEARRLTQEGQLNKALAEYSRAQQLDSSIEVATQEKRLVQARVDAATLAEQGAELFGKRKLIAAARAIDRALRLDPNNARAKAIRELLERERHTIAMDGIELDIASDEPLTLSFKNANIKEVFGVLSQLSGINFIFDEGLGSKTITVLLEKATFAQAMELIMQMNGLGRKVLNSKTIIVYEQSREKEKQYGDQVIQTFYLSHIDAKKAVNLLRTMLQLRKIYVHEERNALVIRDKPEVISLAAQIIEAADRENSEVVFDLELVSVSDINNLNIGPELSTYSTSVGFANGQAASRIISDSLAPGSSVSPDVAKELAGTVVDAVGGGIQSLNKLETYYTLPTATFDLAKTMNDTEILANPKVRVRNREKAKVHIGTREPVVTVTQNGDNFSDSVQYVDVGIKLDVEPTVQLDGSVETKLKLEVSQKISEGTTTRGTKYLTISTTNAETVLTLQDGVQTIIGGLYENQKGSNKTTFPVIGDIPLLGNLFTHFDNNDSKREILLSITPHIIRQLEVPEADVATIWSGGEDDLKDGPNFGSFATSLESEIAALQTSAAPALKAASTEVTPAEATAAEPALPLVDAEPATAPREATAAPPEAEQTAPAVEASNSAPPVAEAAAQPGAQPGTESESEPVVEPVAEPAVEPEVEPVTATLAEAVQSTESVDTEVLPPAREVAASTTLAPPPKAAAVLAIDGPVSVEQGAEITLVARIRKIDKLYSAPLFIRYDPSRLELLRLNEGDFLAQNGQTTVFSNSPNRSTGQIIVGYKQSSGGKGASGEGALFSLTFRALAAGETRVEADRVNFRDPTGRRLQVNAEGATIEVR
jgi:general secretion pathway protein D